MVYSTYIPVNKYKYMDWTKGISVELETGEREEGTDEELEKLEDKVQRDAEDAAERLAEAINDLE